jgi:cytochrome oxidase assembly protein ShyY1
MPDQTIRVLSLGAAGIGMLYVALVITTVVLATWQTSLVARVHETEGNIAALEATYYASVSELNATNPIGEGYVAPTEVHYTEARPTVGLTLAR